MLAEDVTPRQEMAVSTAHVNQRRPLVGQVDRTTNLEGPVFYEQPFVDHAMED
jgi:hypothetical protein